MCSKRENTICIKLNIRNATKLTKLLRKSYLIIKQNSCPTLYTILFSVFSVKSEFLCYVSKDPTLFSTN